MPTTVRVPSPNTAAVAENSSYWRRVRRVVTWSSWLWLIGAVVARSVTGLVRDRRRRRRHIGLLTAAGLVLASIVGTAAAAVPSADPALVHTADGTVRGVVAPDHRTFSGLPFAAPPVGQLRWRAPAPVTPWLGIRDATRPGNRCAQQGFVGGRPTQLGSEDCLYLNVTTPTVAAGAARRPVMVWIPGGGFVQGAGDQYDPTRLATGGRVVVVTLNYRLGALGFLDDPAVSGRMATSGWPTNRPRCAGSVVMSPLSGATRAT